MRRIIDVLLRGEEVEYGFLGISPLPGVGRRTGRGFEIGGIVRNSPAEEARLSPGDIILKVNGRPIREYDDVFLTLAVALAGRPTELVIQPRFGPERTVRATLVKTPIDIDREKNRPREESGIATNKPRAVGGLRVEYTSVIKGETNSQRQSIIPRGVLVRDVEFAAKAAGLVPYADIIVRVNDEVVNSPAEFQQRATAAVNAGKSLTLILSDGRTVTLP
jgi:serine protease Do